MPLLWAIGSIPNNINVPLLWAIITKAFTLLNSMLIRKHSVQFLGSCIFSKLVLLNNKDVFNCRLNNNYSYHQIDDIQMDNSTSDTHTCPLCYPHFYHLC